MPKLIHVHGCALKFDRYNYLILKVALCISACFSACVRALVYHYFRQAVIKQAIMDRFWILKCLKKCFDLLVKMVLSKVALLASMVVKNGTNKTLQLKNYKKLHISAV